MIKDNELFITPGQSITYKNKNVTLIDPKQDYILALGIANNTIAKMCSCNLGQYSD